MPETNYILWALGNLLDEPPLIFDTDGTYEGIDWQKIPASKRPSKQALEAEIVRIKAIEQPELETRKNRAMAYPPIGDQLDALYHAGVFPKEMADKIRAVKEKYPKPNSA